MRFTPVPFKAIDTDLNYCLNTVERITVRVALAISVNASCTTHWVPFW